ncbi:MAG: hypothetical protein ACOZAL_01710 [Patescibacteria group bacterium]
MSRYLKKQLTILIVFLLIILAVGFGIYFLINPVGKETCFDGIQNQSEEGIDCGGPCGPCRKKPDKPLQILSQSFIPTLENNFDLVGKIENPNTDWGVESVVYRFSLYDENNQLIGSLEGNTYLLPQEIKYIVEQRFYAINPPSRISLEIKNLKWQRFQDFEELQLKVKDKSHQLVDGKYQLSGDIENKSTYNLDRVEIIGLLFDEEQNIIAAGKTNINTFVMNETRYFEINWPDQISKEVFSSEIKTYTNVFLDDNFMRVHGSKEKFQEY